MDLGEAAKWTLVIDLFEAVQGSRIRFVLGCVIPCAGAVARSRNLGQAFLGSPVTYVSSVTEVTFVINSIAAKCN